MLADGSVAGTTYVGRHVAVLRATKEVGNGWVMDGGAHDAVLYMIFFFVVVRADEKMRERSILRRLLCV